MKNIKTDLHNLYMMNITKNLYYSTFCGLIINTTKRWGVRNKQWDAVRGWRCGDEQQLRRTGGPSPLQVCLLSTKHSSLSVAGLTIDQK